MFADLHLHTNFSDGTYGPEELAAHAHRLNFKAIALTDHDTVEGCARMALACQQNGVEFIPAAELKKRQRAWKAPKPRYTRGVLAKYASAVTSASLGAVTDADLKL